jgi:hypothetical protein
MCDRTYRQSKHAVALLHLSLFPFYLLLLLLLLALSREGGLHRLSATLSAVREISALPPSAVAAFLDSFELFGETAASYSGSPTDVARLLGYYGVLNHICAVGDFEKMYLPPRLDPSKGVYANQLLYEKRMASSLGVGPGDRVLDVGCGRGLVARGVSDGTGAEVTGLNIVRRGGRVRAAEPPAAGPSEAGVARGRGRGRRARGLRGDAPACSPSVLRACCAAW